MGYVGTVLMHVDENVIMSTFLEANRLCRYSLDACRRERYNEYFP